MNLCFITPEPPPYGGIVNWINIVKKNLQKRNIDYTIINSSHNQNKIGKRNLFDRVFKSGIKMFSQIKKFKEENKLKKFDVVHINTSGSLALIRDIQFLKLCKKKKIKTVLHLHFGRTKDVFLKRNLECLLLKKAIILADTIISMDKKTFEFLKNNYQFKKIFLVPNPIESDIIKINFNDLNIKKKVLFVGWVEKTKGIEELIEAWKKIHFKFLEYQLEIVGPYNLEYKKYIDSIINRDCNIIITGELKHEEVLKKMLECSLFVLPSYTEGFPNVILEAMKCKKTIVATNVGAIPEILDGDCGVVIEPKDTDSLANAMEFCLLNNKISAFYAFNAFNKVNKFYDSNRIVDELIGIWKQKK